MSIPGADGGVEDDDELVGSPNVRSMFPISFFIPSHPCLHVNSQLHASHKATLRGAAVRAAAAAAATTSRYRTDFEEICPIGQGGFGSVVKVAAGSGKGVLDVTGPDGVW